MARLAPQIRPSKESLDGYLGMARELGDDESVRAFDAVVAQLGE